MSVPDRFHHNRNISGVTASRYRRLIKMAAAFLCLALLGAASASSFANIGRATSESTPLLTNANIAQISSHWGQISPYVDNLENYFGVNYVGLPNGCQIEQAHTLQRHAQRFPTGGSDDGTSNQQQITFHANCHRGQRHALRHEALRVSGEQYRCRVYWSIDVSQLLHVLARLFVSHQCRCEDRVQLWCVVLESIRQDTLQRDGRPSDLQRHLPERHSPTKACYPHN